MCAAIAGAPLCRSAWHANEIHIASAVSALDSSADFAISRFEERYPVTIAVGKHLFPSRTQQLSPPAPMVLPWQRGGRVGRRRVSLFFMQVGDQSGLMIHRFAPGGTGRLLRGPMTIKVPSGRSTPDCTSGTWPSERTDDAAGLISTEPGRESTRAPTSAVAETVTRSAATVLERLMCPSLQRRRPSRGSQNSGLASSGANTPPPRVQPPSRFR